LHHRQAEIFKLCDGVEDGCLAADAGSVDGGAGVDVCAAVEQEPRGFGIAELRGNMQQG
jgi:hypothetical protein